MIDIDFINSAYVTMERGFAESRKRKMRLARRSVIKNLLKALLARPENTNEKKFLLHPKPEIQKIFRDAIKLNISNSPFLNKALFFLQLGYITPSEKFRLWAAKKGYGYLQYYFSASNITILNCGPSLLSPFLAKLCEDKNDGSKYFIIQHGLYQHHYQPYEFEFSVEACRSVVWSKLLAQNYITLGMPPEKIHVLPTHLFREVKKLNSSNRVLIIGESLNKINTDFDREYEGKILEITDYLNESSMYNEFHFKKHPRALPTHQLDLALEKNSIKFIDKINLSDYGLVIGAVSTLMIEAMAEGCRVLQLTLNSLNSLNVGDYSSYTSAENLKSLGEVNEKMDRLNNLLNNYIKSEFLLVENHYEDYYIQLLEQ